MIHPLVARFAVGLFGHGTNFSSAFVDIVQYLRRIGVKVAAQMTTIAMGMMTTETTEATEATEALAMLTVMVHFTQMAAGTQATWEMVATIIILAGIRLRDPGPVMELALFETTIPRLDK
jgi:hypothetical protein